MKLAGPLMELLITSRRASTCRGIRSRQLSRAPFLERSRVPKRVYVEVGRICYFNESVWACYLGWVYHGRNGTISPF